MIFIKFHITIYIFKRIYINLFLLSIKQPLYRNLHTSTLLKILVYLKNI